MNFGEIALKNRTQAMWTFYKTSKRSHSFLFCPTNNVINCTMYTVVDFIIFLPLSCKETWETCSAAALLWRRNVIHWKRKWANAHTSHTLSHSRTHNFECLFCLYGIETRDETTHIQMNCSLLLLLFKYVWTPNFCMLFMSEHILHRFLSHFFTCSWQW